MFKWWLKILIRWDPMIQFFPLENIFRVSERIIKGISCHDWKLQLFHIFLLWSYTVFLQCIHPCISVSPKALLTLVKFISLSSANCLVFWLLFFTLCIVSYFLFHLFASSSPRGPALKIHLKSYLSQLYWPFSLWTPNAFDICFGLES